MSVDSWFKNYVSENINIDSKKSARAKTSRNWLTSNIKDLSQKNEENLELYSDSEFALKMGSFARKTQIRPLDDVDQMIIFSAKGSTANLDTSQWNQVFVNVPDSAPELKKMDGENGLSSIKVLNYLKQLLNGISQYQSADIKRSQQALRLELSSYDWGFDIVPGFRTVDDEQGYYYYIIPNGNGTWEKTDPRIDRQNLTEYQKETPIDLREVVRIIKYWRKAHNAVCKLNSYALETTVLDFIDTNPIYSNSREFIENFLLYLSKAVLGSVQDRKGIQGDLNSLDYIDRLEIQEKAIYYHDMIKEANNYESESMSEQAIKSWTNFFGD
ncbi:hypothetical protein LPPLD21_03207 [Lactiplantibacillus paraplantarum]|uniref:Nucleotidyltransferase n=1 Tax=Lactiplantibacillus paraplantarum TaxID=60520 RepID=A0ABQ0NF29_9LACO|nr:nucleotidyltransferase [Lactiplantibacillus paraplantarum]GBF03636.1 hypothetical protein LPPLD21_03207 [Lactiplantibacillus paraplantarum]